MYGIQKDFLFNRFQSFYNFLGRQYKENLKRGSGQNRLEFKKVSTSIHNPIFQCKAKIRKTSPVQQICNNRAVAANLRKFIQFKKYSEIILGCSRTFLLFIRYWHQQQKTITLGWFQNSWTGWICKNYITFRNLS